MTEWLDLKPAHFDTSLLPRKHRKPDPDALFTVADLADPHWANRKPAPKTPDPMEGQAELFPLGD